MLLSANCIVLSTNIGQDERCHNFVCDYLKLILCMERPLAKFLPPVLYSFLTLSKPRLNQIAFKDSFHNVQ